MVHTVGIVGVNGNVGAPTAKSLVKAAQDGKFKVVIFHRESTNLSGFAKGENVEFRILDIDDPPEKIAQAVKGVNVFVSAIGFEGLAKEPNLVEGLAKSPDLVTFIPSTYSAVRTKEDFVHPQTGPFLAFLHCGWEKAKELGLAITPVYCGIFDIYWFGAGFVVPPLKDNIMWANEQQLKNPVPILAMPHFGDALTRIVSADPQSIKNRGFSVVTFWVTGYELVDLYTKINGSKTQIRDFTKADREANMADAAGMGPGKVGYSDRWESGNWNYDADGRTVDREYDGPGLEEVARVFA